MNKAVVTSKGKRPSLASKTNYSRWGDICFTKHYYVQWLSPVYWCHWLITSALSRTMVKNCRPYTTRTPLTNLTFEALLSRSMDSNALVPKCACPSCTNTIMNTNLYYNYTKIYSTKTSKKTPYFLLYIIKTNTPFCRTKYCWVFSSMVGCLLLTTTFHTYYNSDDLV